MSTTADEEHFALLMKMFITGALTYPRFETLVEGLVKEYVGKLEAQAKKEWGEVSSDFIRDHQLDNTTLSQQTNSLFEVEGKPVQRIDPRLGEQQLRKKRRELEQLQLSMKERIPCIDMAVKVASLSKERLVFDRGHPCVP